MRNGETPMTLAERLGTASKPTQSVPTARAERKPEPASPPLIRDEPAERGPEHEPRVEARQRPLRSPEAADALRQGLAATEERARRVADEIALVQSSLRLVLETALAEAAQAPRFPRRELVLRMGRSLVVLLLLVLAVTGAWKAGLLWTGTGENLVLDSGIESKPLRWRPAGLQSNVTRAAGVGRGGSAALQVRTRGSNDGEGAAYFDADGIRSGEPETFSAFVHGLESAAVYAEIRWRARDGSFIQASRGSVARVTESWRRVVVTGTGPEGAASALLVIGEAAGTSMPVRYLVDDAQLERGKTARTYVQTGDQAGGRPAHPTDVAALLMLLAAGLLAFTYLRAAVLVFLPLSLAIPPSFASFESHLPDMTPTRALVIGCLGATIARRKLQAPPRLLIALAAAYSLVVLLALVGDPSIVSIRLALSLTIGAFAPALLVLAVARERRDLWILAGSLAATAAAAAAVALAEWYFDRHWISLYPGVIFDALERGDHLRARATFPHPIALGTFLALAMPLVLSVLLTTRGIRRIAVGAVGVILLAGLAVTLSRAPWLGAGIGLATFAGLSGIWRRWRIILAVAAVLAAVTASPLGLPMRDAAVGLVRPQTEQERFVVQVRVDLAKRIGGEGLRTLVSSSLDPADQPAFPAVIEGREVDLSRSIDNTYVRVLAQTGLLGLLALVALLLAVTIETIRGALRQQDGLRHLTAGLAAAQLVVLVVGLTVGTISFSQVGTAFWLIAGAGVAVRLLDEHEPDLE